MSAPLRPPLSRPQVRELLARQQRLALACLPTPLQELTQLSRTLAGPRIFIKREDLTGTAFGGNKTRNLDFRLTRAVEARADVLIMALEITSNSARQTVGSANRLGMQTVLVLKGEEPEVIQGNLLVNYLLGAEVHYARDAAEQEAIIRGAVERAREQGKRPLVLTSEPIFDIGSALAYLECTVEILDQMEPLGARPDYLYMTSGGKGQAGLVLAQKLLHEGFAVHGITVSYEYDVQSRTAKIANDTARHLGVDLRVEADEIRNFDDYVGPGYGVTTREGFDAIRLMARTEGIILDPIYTGKCLAGLVDHIRTGRIEKDATVVFVHTGGTPAIFSHDTELLAHLGVQRRPRATDRRKEQA